MKLLLEHGADVNATDRVSLKNTSSLAFAHDSLQRKGNANASVWFHVPKSVVYYNSNCGLSRLKIHS